VAKLIAKSPLAGLLPVQVGGLHVTEVALGQVTSIALYDGAQDAAGAALAELGLAFPAPGQTAQNVPVRILWSGRRTALLIGAPPPEALRAHAALTDQTGAQAALAITGAGADELLARLVPLDLRPAAFPNGQTARSTLGHMPASITRTGEGFEILTFRSMAMSLVHELTRAARIWAARPE